MSACTWLVDERRRMLADVGGRKQRVTFAREQLVDLERVFALRPYVTASERRALAHRVGLTELQVKTWFQNRRQKYRRERKEREQRNKKQ